MQIFTYERKYFNSEKQLKLNIKTTTEITKELFIYQLLLP